MKATPHIIGIAGPSGSGKTELARWLARALDGAAVLALDNYYRKMDHLALAERARSNFDEPSALEWELLFENLKELAAGRTVEIPAYDFARHTRKAEPATVAPGKFIVVEGLFTLHWPEVRSVLDTKVFVRTDPEVCFRRRLERDVVERGRTPESVRNQWEATVRPGAEAYIWPTERFADVVVSGEQPLEMSLAAVLEALKR
jgi:uridine kinase